MHGLQEQLLWYFTCVQFKEKWHLLKLANAFVDQVFDGSHCRKADFREEDLQKSRWAERISAILKNTTHMCNLSLPCLALCQFQHYLNLTWTGPQHEEAASTRLLRWSESGNRAQWAFSTPSWRKISSCLFQNTGCHHWHERPHFGHQQKIRRSLSTGGPSGRQLN